MFTTSIVIFALCVLWIFARQTACSQLVQSPVPVGGNQPYFVQAKPNVPPYSILRIQLRGRCQDSDSANGLVQFHPLIYNFYYASRCNPQPHSQSQKISLVQGPGGGTTATATVTVAAGGLGVWTITNPGAGYDQFNPPWIYILDSAGVGTGAVAKATVSPTGTITAITNVSAGGHTVGGVDYTGITAVISPPQARGFQGTVAGPLIWSVFGKAWINDGIYAQWIDTPSDMELMVGSATLLGGGVRLAAGDVGPIAGGGGVIPAGGYLAPTGDGGVGLATTLAGATSLRLPLFNNVTIHKFTGLKGRNWTGKAWHPSVVPTAFFAGDDMTPIGKIMWNAMKYQFAT